MRRRSTAASARAAIVFALAGCGVIAAAGDAAGASTAPCPARAPATLSAAAPVAARVLVPSGARSLLLCSYHGLNPTSLAGTLEHSRTVTARSTVTHIATELDRLRAQSTAVFHCPMDDGSEILAIFTYPSAATATVSIGLTGCQLVTNGRTTRTASLPPGPALLALLARLL